MSEKVIGIHAVQAFLQKEGAQVDQLFIQSRSKNARIKDIEQLARQHGIKPVYVDKQELDLHSDGGNHQGVVLLSEVSSRVYQEREIDSLLDQATKPILVLILDGIQDPHNLGACLRTANGAGVHMVIAPKDKSVGITATVRKVACGAVENTPFIAVTNLARTMEQLKQRGIWISGADAETDKTVFDADFKGDVAIVIGNEGKGMRRLTREQCDFLVKIPMQGSVESLNASVATGVCLYEVRRQRLISA